MARDPVLTPEERRFVADARRAVLATVDPRGRPRLVPICHVVGDRDDAQGRPLLYTPIDDKPKATSDPRALARVRDLLARPEVSVLVDRWDEDWTRLGWLRLHGTADLLEPSGPGAGEHAAAVGLLRSKYPQYRNHPLENRPIIRIAVDEARGWGAIDGSATGTRG